MPTVLLIGEGDLAEETRQALDAAGAEVYRMKAPEEREVRHALEGDGIDRVVIVSRDDAVVLRVALMVRHVDDDVPMLVTIFDPTMAGQVDRDLEHCEVTSMADIVAPVACRSVPGRRPDRCPRGRGTRRSASARPATGSRRCRSRCPTSGAQPRWRRPSSRRTTRAPRCCCGARSGSW